jgi:hypothetical protein
MELTMQALQSIIIFCNLVLSGSLHIKKNHLWEKYKVSDGEKYSVFLETISDKEYYEREVTIVIGFRLFIIKSNPFFHFLFQKLCVLDTPIWVGFRGFKKKYWMVDLQTKNYLGIYRYQGRKNAQKYVNYIVSVLKPLSTKDSVWSEILDINFDNYVAKRIVV